METILRLAREQKEATVTLAVQKLLREIDAMPPPGGFGGNPFFDIDDDLEEEGMEAEDDDFLPFLHIAAGKTNAQEKNTKEKSGTPGTATIESVLMPNEISESQCHGGRMNPYDRLGIATDANDETIRNAYLAAIKRFPPERFPEQFTAISEAYQTLKDEDSRLRYLLFEKAPGVASPMDAVRSHFVGATGAHPPDFETLKGFLRRCAAR